LPRVLGIYIYKLQGNPSQRGRAHLHRLHSSLLMAASLPFLVSVRPAIVAGSRSLGRTPLLSPYRPFLDSRKFSSAVALSCPAGLFPSPSSRPIARFSTSPRAELKVRQSISGLLCFFLFATAGIGLLLRSSAPFWFHAIITIHG
ncbi:hypothetical protein BHE74_00025407, partial [Ensete ventricosum]